MWNYCNYLPPTEDAEDTPVGTSTPPHPNNPGQTPATGTSPTVTSNGSQAPTVTQEDTPTEPTNDTATSAPNSEEPSVNSAEPTSNFPWWLVISATGAIGVIALIAGAIRSNRNKD